MARNSDIHLSLLLVLSTCLMMDAIPIKEQVEQQRQNNVSQFGLGFLLGSALGGGYGYGRPHGYGGYGGYSHGYGHHHHGHRYGYNYYRMTNFKKKTCCLLFQFFLCAEVTGMEDRECSSFQSCCTFLPISTRSSILTHLKFSCYSSKYGNYAWASLPSHLIIIIIIFG
jgi:hypothetical protein